jgi:uncharacterized protein
MLFALICTDKPNSQDIRQNVRPDHLKHVQGLGGSLKFAGPFLTDEGAPNGSLLVIEASDKAAARQIADNDPYNKAGLFSSVDVRPWKWAINNPEAAK